MKTYFAYIRVSTTKQGDEGVSLQEQRRAILEYASKRGITITKWFEEQISAAKRGRPIFTRMVGMLKSKKSTGLIIHKIDRGARNLRDWADMAELMDRGIEVHFAHESIDLHTRSGRLSADILAVVAADYIRNLREEVVKGINGRLRQGLFPFSAPIGYLNTGPGKAKTVDPVRGPYVKMAFELYASRRYSITKLEKELFEKGFRTKTGKIVYASQLATILRNPFYMGLIRLKNRKDTFSGIHTPLITSSLFNDVQFLLDGKRSLLKHLNPCLFRLRIRCEQCNLYVVGERHKGHVYYRCHRRACRARYIREERFEASIVDALKRINVVPDEELILKEMLRKFKQQESEVSQALRRDADAEHEQVLRSIKTLLQKFLDNAVSKEMFDDGHTALLMQRKASEEKITALNAGRDIHRQIQDFLVGLRSVCERFCTGSAEQMRTIMDEMFQSISIRGPVIRVTLSPFMEQIAGREKTTEGWEKILPIITRELAGR
jgi:site-specific DNA recombinase